MVDYTKLVTAWNSATQPPVGVTGLALTGLTTKAKLDAVSNWTVAGTAGRVFLAPSAILNAIVFADLAALTALQVAQLTLLLQGGSVDVSPGSTIRLGIQALFAGKTTTLANLGALVAPLDAPPQVPWLQANGYGPLSLNDIAAAGLS